jgi:hypothetical protein
MHSDHGISPLGVTDPCLYSLTLELRSSLNVARHSPKLELNYCVGVPGVSCIRLARSCKKVVGLGSACFDKCLDRA